MKGAVNNVTMTIKPRVCTPRISLKLTKANGHTIELRTVVKSPPTADMVEMADQLAMYLSTGKKPKGWNG